MSVKVFFKQYAPLLAFGLLVAIVLLAIRLETRASDDKIYKAQLESCERVNVLRAETNTQGEVLRDFLRDAAQVRRVTAHSQPRGVERTQNLKAAENWQKWAAQLREVTVPVCSEVILPPR